MKEIKVLTYHSQLQENWNAFLKQSKNGTFLFHRDFMEYHRDRFEDYSLMIYVEEKLAAILPANRVGDTFYSHQGLTYGGLVLSQSVKANEVYEIYKKIIQYLKDNNFKEFIFKQIINIYCKQPANEIDCFLIQDGATLFRKDLNLAIDFKKEMTISKSKLKHFRKEDKSLIEIRKDNEFETFWDKVLIPRLYEKYEVNPVHTKEEIVKLHTNFPENIFQYNAYYDDEIVAGITLFVFDNVIKSQYGATTINGEKIRALDYLFITLINEYKERYDFFDMGTVTDSNKFGFNQGLLNQKQELGCAVYAQDFYKLIM